MNGASTALPHKGSAEGNASDAAFSATASALAALVGSAAALESIAQQLPLNILILDTQLVIKWANDAVAQSVSSTAAELIGRNWGDIIPLNPQRAQIYQRVFSGEEVDMSEAPFQSGGRTHYHDLRFRPVRDKTGVIVGVLILGKNVRDSERMLRKVTEASADYLALLDANLRIVFLNRGLGKLAAQDLEGRHVTEFMPQNVHPAAIACMRGVLETRCPDRYEGQIAMPGGELRQFEFRVNPVIEDDRVTGLTLNGSDITEYRQAERAIATQAKMIESMLEGVAVVTGSGAIEITNPAFDGIFGCTRGELIGQRLNTLSDSGAAGEDELGDIAGLLGKRDSIPLEFEGLHRNGSRLAVAGVLSRFGVAGRNRYLAVLQDVSERKALERAILEAGNREQYRIGNDLHDGLGQELTGIALMLKSVATRMAKEHPAVLPDIDSIARLVSNAVESTRALARGLSPVNLERGGLIDALEGLAMHARDLYGTKVSFAHQLRTAEQIPAELGNHFYRIAQEAVTNAVRHGEAQSIRIQLAVSRGKIRMSVSDDGRGMPPDALEAPGMGLKIMQHRARISGGTVHFESPAEGGMRIVCECPLQPPRLSPRGKTRKRKVAA